MKMLIQNKGQRPRELVEGYADEKQLQEFLRDHADLIPVEEFELGTPQLLCIGWEVHGASGYEDLLYVDETGLLTIVETKLKKNPEARREVVAQILEYAADTWTWTADDIEQRAQRFFARKECTEEYRGLTFEEALRRFLEKTASDPQEPFSYADFLDRVEQNLSNGHIRLVIAIDKPLDTLRKLVEYINLFSEHFEMYLFQLRLFKDVARDQNIFVPALFGRVAKPETARRSGELWNKEAFLRRARVHYREEEPVLNQLIEFSEGEEAIRWGKGVKGSFQFEFTNAGGKSITAFYVEGARMSFDFKKLQGLLDEATIASYREALALAQDVPEEAINTNTWKYFDVAALSSTQSWNAFKKAVLALERAVETQR